MVRPARLELATFWFVVEFRQVRNTIPYKFLSKIKASSEFYLVLNCRFLLRVLAQFSHRSQLDLIMQTGNRANLNPSGNPKWIKGVSRNPAGRPKNEPLWSPELRRHLREVCPADPQRRMWLEVLAERLLELACKGNPAAIKELLERIDGKVPANLQLDIQLTAVQNMTDAELEAIIARSDSTE
jgi:hypothetical protein